MADVTCGVAAEQQELAELPSNKPSETSPEWVEVAADAPYFTTPSGAWTPVGHNDAIAWPTLAGLLKRRDLPAVESYFRQLSRNRVTCLRLMLEYAQGEEFYFENPIGHFVPEMVQLWDDLFALAQCYGLRLLLTPFDTFWTWERWDAHPYNLRNGGFLRRPDRLLLCRRTREAIKNRLRFAVERWGHSGSLFAWDLWNEIHPGQAQESADCFPEFIHEISAHVRALERGLYGRSHLQTVSLFGPEMKWRPQLPLAEMVLRHPALDFATIHVYERGTIDDPQDTVAPALAMGRIVAETISLIPQGRPFFDSEHGPIHSFKDHDITLPVAFDDECFRNTQWAHIASGGAGGGMRWPNRHPHVLTPGMHNAQRSLAGFCDLLDWSDFRRMPAAVRRCPEYIQIIAISDEKQAVAWMVRTDLLGLNGQLQKSKPGIPVELELDGFCEGSFAVVVWNTERGVAENIQRVHVDPDHRLHVRIPCLRTDAALAIRRIERGRGPRA